MDPNRFDLRFTSEYVLLEINHNSFTRGELNATYLITNSGSNWINQTIALPGYSIYAEEGEAVITIQVDEASIEYWFDAVEIENIMPISNEYFCFLFNLTFQPLQTRKISVDFPFTIDRYTPGNLSAKYIVTTGNSWAGSIGQADIFYKFPTENVNDYTSIAPSNYTFENESTNFKIIHWHYEDWNPREEILVKWIPDLPLDVAIEPDEINCICNESIMINATVVMNGNPESNVGGYELYYDLGDGSNTGWIHSLNWTHIYQQPGTYHVKVWVKYTNYNIISDEPGELMVTVGEKVENNTSIYLLAGIIISIVVIFSLGLFWFRAIQSKQGRK